MRGGGAPQADAMNENILHGLAITSTISACLPSIGCTTASSHWCSSVVTSCVVTGKYKRKQGLRASKLSEAAEIGFV